MELSLKKMELDFSEAKEALTKLSKTAIPFKTEQEMVTKEIQRAIQEVQKLQLDKNISQLVPVVDILKAIEKLDIKISKDAKADKLKQKKIEKQIQEKVKKEKTEALIITEDEIQLPLLPVNFQETDYTRILFNKWLLSQLMETKDSTLLEQRLLMNTDSSFREKWEILKQKIYQEKKKVHTQNLFLQ